ncbi:MAG: septum formation initiator family protein [Lachnospiraceae bacterium]|nr:septum formation initiator family protein [Lachnospiraceae bacterium]
MKKSRSSVKQKKNRISMMVIAAVAILLLSGLLVQGNTIKNQLAVYDAQEASIQEQIDTENKRTAEIDQLKEYMQTDDYAEEVAREKLGLVKDNEIVFQEKEEASN